MRARSVIVSLICTAALVLAGCGGSISGTPQLADDVSPITTGASQTTPGQPTPATDNPATTPTGADSSNAPDSPTDSADDTTTGDDGNSDLPTAGPGDTGQSGIIPTDLIPTDLIPTDLTGIPGLGGECLGLLAVYSAVGMLFLAPLLGGQSVTKDQVDQAFAQLGDVPAELAGPMKVLHDAAVSAIGKPAAEAMEVFDSDEVNQALDAIGDYAETKCGGS